jgi:4-hydroxyphenylacetate 3-monooxygenase
MPSAADLNGPLAEDIRLYYESARMTAAERIPLYRLAWDVSVSAFATRQVLYERFFFGDPVQLAGVVFQTKNRTAQMEKVRSFLQKACEVSP